MMITVVGYGNIMAHACGESWVVRDLAHPLGEGWVVRDLVHPQGEGWVVRDLAHPLKKKSFLKIQSIQ